MKYIIHEPLSYNYAMPIASAIIEEFYVKDSYLDDFKYDLITEILHTIVKPQKITLLHLYISWLRPKIGDLKEYFQVDKTKKSEATLYFKALGLQEFGADLGKKELPDFSALEECGNCNNCIDCMQLKEYIAWLEKHQYKIGPYITHSVFQILMMNKGFLRDFHESFAGELESDGDLFLWHAPDHFDKYGRIKRKSWPSWLKRGIFYRDRGVCTLCRKDLSGQLALGIEPELDHIVPLANFGTNDASNVQLLCNECNNKKRHYSSSTSTLNIPVWNISRKDQFFDLI